MLLLDLKGLEGLKDQDTDLLGHDQACLRMVLLRRRRCRRLGSGLCKHLTTNMLKTSVSLQFLTLETSGQQHLAHSNRLYRISVARQDTSNG